MAKKQQSASDKAQNAAYSSQGRFAKNKEAKLRRHLKNCPDDAQAQAALDNMKTSPSRKKPDSKMWKKSQMGYANTLASLGYNGNAARGDKAEEANKDEVIGFGVKQILDVPESARNKPNKKSKGKN